MWDVFGHFCVFLARIVFAVAVAVLVYVVMTAGKNIFKVKQRIKEHILYTSRLFRYTSSCC